MDRGLLDRASSAGLRRSELHNTLSDIPLCPISMAVREAINICMSMYNLNQISR